MAQIIIGIDEVGRGALAGPMYLAGAVISSNHPLFSILTRINQASFEFYLDIKERYVLRDSKKMTLNQRLKTAELLRSDLDYCLVAVSNSDIDKHGLSRAFSAGVAKILAKLAQKYPLNSAQVFIDGNVLPNLNSQPAKIMALAKADDRIGIVAAAAVLAKVKRDLFMVDLDAKYPGYQWRKNVGYGTKNHIQAIKTIGPSPYHRLSFLRNILGLSRNKAG